MNLRTTLLPILLAVGCQQPASPPTEGPPELTEARAGSAIAGHAEFAEPIWTEIWSHRPGPSARALEAQGLLRFDQDAERLALTDAAASVEARENSFQQGIPVFYFPVARRALTTVSQIDDLPDSGLTRVRFEYRTTRTDVGATIVESGGRIGVDDDLLLRGTAYLTDDDAEWQVVLLDL